jgi:hypothetical protein
MTKDTSIEFIQGVRETWSSEARFHEWIRRMMTDEAYCAVWRQKSERALDDLLAELKTDDDVE